MLNHYFPIVAGLVVTVLVWLVLVIFVVRQRCRPMAVDLNAPTPAWRRWTLRGWRNRLLRRWNRPRRVYCRDPWIREDGHAIDMRTVQSLRERGAA